jgi:hypothetical protein
VRGGRTCGSNGGHLIGQLIRPTRRKHHRRTWGQSGRQLEPDLASPAEYHDQPSVRRVFHGCDYVLR